MDALFSRTLKAKDRTYFFDVREANNNTKYVSIAESQKERGEEGKFKRSSIVVFSSQFEEFAQALNEALNVAKG